MHLKFRAGYEIMGRQRPYAWITWKICYRKHSLYMKRLEQRPSEQYGYLLSSIPNARLFIKRKKDYDSELIGRCNANFLLYRRDTGLGKVREANPKKRRMTVEYKLTKLPVMNNTERRSRES